MNWERFGVEVEEGDSDREDLTRASAREAITPPIMAMPIVPGGVSVVLLRRYEGRNVVFGEQPCRIRENKTLDLTRCGPHEV